MPSTPTPPSVSRRPLRGVPWLLLAASAALGCSGEITVLPGSTTGDPGETPDGPGETPDETCLPGDPNAQPDPAPLALGGVTSAVFVGDTLHLEATLDGTPRYVVLSIDADGLARAVATPDELLGPATLAEVSPGLHARLRAGEAGLPILDVVDTSHPEAPALLASTILDGMVDEQPVFNAADGRFFFCLRPQAGEKAQLFSLDLTTPAAPSAPEPAGSLFCYHYGDHSYSTIDATAISWNHPTGNYAQDVRMWAFGGAGPAYIMDLGYNQTGVHQYGNVLFAATSRERAVFDPENKHLFLLANRDSDATTTDNPPFTWASFTVGSERQLLGVADTVVYLSTDDAIRAYDITDILAPKLLPYEAWLSPYEAPLRTLAASPLHLAVADAKGTLFLLPRTSPGTVTPLIVHAPDYAPPGTDTTCLE